MTRRSVTFFATLFAVVAAVYFFVGPGIEPAASRGQPEPAVCDPEALERAAEAHCGGLVPFSVVASGTMGDRREAGVEVVADEAGWVRLVDRGLLPADLEPPDFAESAVLVVHAGRRPTAGYGVTVTRIRLMPETEEADGPELLVEATVAGPPEGSMAATVLTAPYVAVALPADATESKNLTIETKFL